MIETYAAKPLRSNLLRGLLALVAGAAACLLADNAQAGGLFDTLFGGPVRTTYAYPDQRSNGAVRREPAARTESPATSTATLARAFCVRLCCDGRYYPIASAGNATPVQMCSAMCPAAKTTVFRGGEIASATDPTGARYSRLEQAFAYRKSVVPGCSCNGKDPYGLVSVEVAADPTLRSGDLVATADGLKTIQGRTGSRDIAALNEKP
jgi:uncharacterized protein DUF2865